MTDTPAANPMIADAIRRGEDTTGLCTVRELVAAMVTYGGYVERLWFTHDEFDWVVEIQIINRRKVEGGA